MTPERLAEISKYPDAFAAMDALFNKIDALMRERDELAWGNLTEQEYFDHGKPRGFLWNPKIHMWMRHTGPCQQCGWQPGDPVSNLGAEKARLAAELAEATRRNEEWALQFQRDELSPVALISENAALKLRPLREEALEKDRDEWRAQARDTEIALEELDREKSTEIARLMRVLERRDAANEKSSGELWREWNTLHDERNALAADVAKLREALKGVRLIRSQARPILDSHLYSVPGTALQAVAELAERVLAEIAPRGDGEAESTDSSSAASPSASHPSA